MLGAAASVHAQVVVTGSFVHEHEARPGEAHHGTIRVSNMGSEPQEARVYQTDYLFYADGRTRYDDAGTTPRSNAGWIVVSPSWVVIPPRKEVTIDYTVTVPRSAFASREGTYWSMIMVEGRRGESESGSKGSRTATPEMRLQPTTRYGVQIVTELPPRGVASLEFTNPQVLSPGDRKEFHVDLVNAGSLGYRPELKLELYDELGTLAKHAQQKRGLIFPGCSSHQVFDLSGLPAGDYRAVVIGDTGGEEVFGAQYRLTL